MSEKYEYVDSETSENRLEGNKMSWKEELKRSAVDYASDVNKAQEREGWFPDVELDFTNGAEFAVEWLVSELSQGRDLDELLEEMK